MSAIPNLTPDILAEAAGILGCPLDPEDYDGESGVAMLNGELDAHDLAAEFSEYGGWQIGEHLPYDRRLDDPSVTNFNR